eukprot:6998237-Prorocentrum_lima.AAC.1
MCIRDSEKASHHNIAGIHWGQMVIPRSVPPVARVAPTTLVSTEQRLSLIHISEPTRLDVI